MLGWIGAGHSTKATATGSGPALEEIRRRVNGAERQRAAYAVNGPRMEDVMSRDHRQAAHG